MSELVDDEEKMKTMNMFFLTHRIGKPFLSEEAAKNCIGKSYFLLVLEVLVTFASAAGNYSSIVFIEWSVPNPATLPRSLLSV